jgi:hypothetical protein
VLRSFVSALTLALFTVAGVLQAFLALAPVVLRRGPVGRRIASIGGPRADRTQPASRRAEQAMPR